MFVIMRKVGSSPDYNLCYKFNEYADAQAKYQELLREVAPSKLLLISTTEARLRMVVHGDGTVTLSPEGEFPVATETEMGIIRLATALQANYANPQNYVDGMPVSVPPTLIKSMIDDGVIEALSYETEYNPGVTNVTQALNDIYEQLNYVPLEITSFFAPVTMYEKGLTPTITCSWSYNKNQDIIWQTLDNHNIAASLRTYALQDISSTKDIILSASDGTEIATKTLRILFTNRIYWGSATLPSSFNSNWIKQLSDNRLSETYQGSYSYNAGTEQYAFVAAPVAYNMPSQAYINCWLTDLVNCGIIDFVSDTGQSIQYQIYRTSNSGLGNFNLLFK